MRQESLFPSLECLGPSRVSRSSRPSQSATRISWQNAGPPHNRVSYSTATSLSHCLDTEAISHLRRLSCSPDPPSAYILPCRCRCCCGISLWRICSGINRVARAAMNISIAEACIQYLLLVYLTYLTIHLMTRTTRSTATPSISHVVQHWYQSRCALVKRKELLFKETAYESSSSSLSFSFCMPPGSCSRLFLYSCTPQTPPLSLSFIPGQL